MNGEKFGKYRLIKKIAVGGMAEIFYASIFGPSGFKKDLVVKKILPNLASQKDFIDMFADEARIVAQMNHPNIVQVFDFGDIDGHYYIAMEYVKGRDLRQVIDRHKTLGRPMDVKFALAVVRDVAKALQYAHSMRDENGRPLGIIHRDVTPRNILISFQGAVKLTDFGVAKARARITHTRAGVLKGKFGYMAPEQVMGRDVDSRMDIFSLSSVLWETMALKRLFYGNSEAEILGKLLHQTVPSIQEYCPEHYNCVQELLNEGLAKDPDMRFQSAAELARAARDCMGLLDGDEPDIGVYMKELFGVEEQTFQDAPGIESKKTMSDEQTLAMDTGDTGPQDKTLMVDEVIESPVAGTQGLQKDENIASSGAKHGFWGLVFAILVVLAGSGIGIWAFTRGNNSKKAEIPSKISKIVTPGRQPTPTRIYLRINNEKNGLTIPRRQVADLTVRTQRHKRMVHKSKPGTLTLNAIPWALVWIDGKKHGVTPISNLRLNAGTHRVRLMMGKKSKRFRLVIRAGHKLTKIVDMSRL